MCLESEYSQQTLWNSPGQSISILQATRGGDVASDQYGTHIRSPTEEDNRMCIDYNMQMLRRRRSGGVAKSPSNGQFKTSWVINLKF